MSRVNPLMTQAAAQKALDLDDQLAEPQAVLAVVKYNYDWDWATAEKMFQRAITLNPNYATARQWYGECLLYQGRIDGGTAEIEHAYELDPASLIINTQRGFAYLWGRQLERAMGQYRKTLELEPNYSTALCGLGHYTLNKSFTAKFPVTKTQSCGCLLS